MRIKILLTTLFILSFIQLNAQKIVKQKVLLFFIESFDIILMVVL